MGLRAVHTGSLSVLVLLSAASALPCQDRPLDWRFEERLRIGPALDGPEAFFRAFPSRGVSFPDRVAVGRRILNVRTLGRWDTLRGGAAADGGRTVKMNRSVTRHQIEERPEDGGMDDDR